MSAANAAQPKTVASLRANLILGGAPAGSVAAITTPASAAADVLSSASKLTESLQRDVEQLKKARDAQQLLLEQTRGQAATREKQLESDIQTERAKCAELSKVVASLQEQQRLTALQPRPSLPPQAVPPPQAVTSSRPPAPALASATALEKRQLPPTDSIASDTLRQQQSPPRSIQPLDSKQHNGRSDQLSAVLSPKARGAATATTALVRPSLISMTTAAAEFANHHEQAMIADSIKVKDALVPIVSNPSVPNLALQLQSTPALDHMPSFSAAAATPASTAAAKPVASTTHSQVVHKSESVPQAASAPAQSKRVHESRPKAAVASKDSALVSASASSSFELIPASSVASKQVEALAAKFGFKTQPPAQSASGRVGGAQGHARMLLPGDPFPDQCGDALDTHTPPVSQPPSAVVERSSSSMSSLPSTPQRLDIPRLASREGRLRSAEPNK